MSPFRRAGARRRLIRAAACIALAIAASAAVTWFAMSGTGGIPAPGRPKPQPSDAAISYRALAAARPPPRLRLVHLRAPDVQESCVGRLMPGDKERVGGPAAMIDSNPLTSWHCDGDGARRHPPMSLAVFFPRALTLTGVGVIGFDPYRPCRFVVRMALVAGGAGYAFRLPAAVYPRLRWFAVPRVRASQVTLVVLQTAVPAGRHGPNCARTAIAQVGFATSPQF